MSHSTLPPAGSSTSSSYQQGYKSVDELDRSNPHPCNSGPDDSNNANAPRWGVGWRPPTAVVFLYLFAILCATSHLLFFHHLNGRRPKTDTNIPQSWIAPISFILALVFRAALCSCLSLVFAQHMWRVMARSVLPVQVIDRLYGLQRSIFALPHIDNIRTSPTLFLLICLYWTIPLAVIFPSGALIVEGRLYPDTFRTMVPTFDPAFTGNGSVEDVYKHSLASSDELYEFQPFEGPVILPNIMKSSAAISLASDQTFTVPSPCGSNCTYTTDFEGPFVQCNTTVSNKTQQFESAYDWAELFKLFTGGWKHGGWERNNLTPDEDGSISVTVVPDTFSLTTVPPYAWRIKPNEDSKSNKTYYMWTTTQLDCTPCRAKYTVLVNYTFGAVEYKVATLPIDCLSDFWYPDSLNMTESDFSFNNSKSAVGNLRATNLFILISSLVESMSGELGWCSMLDNGTETSLGNIRTSDGQIIDASNTLVLYCQAPRTENGSIVVNTPFNTRRFAAANEAPEIIITQDLLNMALLNITLSAMNRLSLWSTRAEVTTHVYTNTFSFAQPIRFILPYFVPLALTLPFLAFGFVAMWRNGAIVPTDGFIDTVVLVSRSEELKRAAKKVSFRAGSVGDVKGLGQLGVRYGEFVEEGEGGQRLTGLGVEHELRGVRR